jgi:glycerophosphoryl diester phosphodiesterase
MWKDVRALLAGAVADLPTAWRSLAITDAAYKAIAFALLTPAASWLIHWFRAGTSDRVVADTDIARFFITTPAGIATLIVGTSFVVAIMAVEIACLIAIGLGSAGSVKVNARGALRFGSAHARNVLRLGGHMVLRVLAALIPFVLAGGVVYLALLREYDINYYLSQRPWQFHVAAVLVALIGAALVFVFLRTIARWALALPLVLVEQVPPRRALVESARRGAGSYAVILATLAVWASAAIMLVLAATALVDLFGRTVAPLFADSLALLLLVIALLVLAGAVLLLTVGILNISLFALLIVRLYLRTGSPEGAVSAVSEYASGGSRRLSGREMASVTAVALLAAVGIGLAAFLASRGQNPALTIAHRGASAAAPENTLAAFRLAAEQRADFVELDVQESADGEVLVVHDSDLMKVGNDRTKIWEGVAARLREIDIGGYRGPQFSSERVPTLAEALAACKGRCRVVVELKSYGHNERLEERVVAIVEQAGMERDCIFMSLDHDMMRKLKALRPSWRVGLLVAKAVGDLTELEADFLAVEARMATHRFVRRAHNAGQDVYIWTVNDPAWMLVGLSHGVDGLITDKPDVARAVIERRAQMSDAQRFLVAQLIRLGASTEALEAEDALRP